MASGDVKAQPTKATTTEEEEEETTISRRARHTIQKNDFLSTYASVALGNPFHPEDNPEGIINMGTALNHLMDEEMQARLQERDGLRYDRQFQHYYELSGTKHVRRSVADFLKRRFCPERNVDPENVVVLNGVASCLDALGHAICDPGDVLITPTPVYGRIFSNFRERALVDVRGLDTTEQTDAEGKSFSLRPDALERKIQELLGEGKRVKGIILVHPHNPMGDFYSKTLLLEILQVCKRYKLHVVVDEIYALSIFQDPETFVSTLALNSATPDPERVHFVWGLTKDLVLAGFRVGVVHSLNKDVITCLKRISTFQCTPSIIQNAAATIMNDKDWFDGFFLPTNRRKLGDAYRNTRQRLEEMGFQVREGKAGFFLWVSAKAFMKENTKEAELELFEAIFKKGVYIVPGSQLYCVSPGWFRLIFTIPPEKLEVGLAKIKSALDERRK
ncbi:1-aminocyclopropane-1-carboxylate synthase-like protein 1 [Macrobrachium rosenbergii]|uniref:1-aminocyclopropane-1-carboxylate synthase-like protein 1 n=1 Tax=Macrobrachium rosenbergii TaxID=79674 RepID=UPI0034D6BFA3